MSGVERKTSREPNACTDLSEAKETSDPRVSKEPSRPRSIESAPIRDSGTAGAVQAANASKIPAPPPLTAAQAHDLPDAFLDRQAQALRSKLSRGTSYPDEARDQAELKTIEGELTARTAARAKAAQEEHGGVKVCKRTADLPGNGLVGAQHWWIKTTRKEVGMGQADGKVPGHGESGPPGLQTSLVDHSKEPKTHCDVQPGVDEDCVDRELVLGKPTGTWVPGVNDCHTVVSDILDRCQTNTREKALEEDTRRRLIEQDGGAP